MRKAYFAIPIIAMLLVFASYQIFTYEEVEAANSKQALLYQNTILTDELREAQKGANSSGTSLSAPFGASVSFYIGTHDSLANQTLMKEGFVPNCLESCSQISYYLDPTTLITNEGHGIIEQYLAGQCSGSPNCSIYTGFATIVAVSPSTNAAAVTDTAGGFTGPCTYGSLVLTPSFNSLAAVQGVVATGSPSGGSVFWNVGYTWTFSKGINNINAGCLYTGILSSGGITTPGLFAEISGVGPFTLAGGDTLTEQWSITAT